MHLEVEHAFDAAAGDVVAVLCDPAFHEQLELPDLSRPEVLASSADGTSRLLRLRYEYVGRLDPIARTILASRRLTWVQELRVDASTGAGTLAFSAEADARRLHGESTLAIDALGPARCRRRITGDFHVEVPLVGGKAERAIVPGLVRRLDVEAAALTRELAARA